MKRSLFWTCLSLAILVLGPSHADELGLDRLEHFTSRNGLPQNWVLDLYQDSQGFLWIGTDDGLNRFDGYRFKVYRNDPRNPRSLSDNFVTCAYEDRHGDLWVGTRKGLNRLDRSRDDFVRFRHDGERPDSLSNNFVTDLEEDANGALWVATMNGANRFDRAAETFRRFHHQPEVPDSLSDSATIRLLRGRGGELWLGTADGTLHRRDDDGEGFKRYRLHEGGGTSGGIWAIAEDAAGRLWTVTDRGDLIGLEPSTERRIHHRLSASGVTSLSAILVRPDGTLWLGSEHNGLLVFEPETGAFTTYRHNPDDPGSLISNRIMHFLEDRSGVIWLGTDAGLDKLDPSRLRFAHYRHRINDNAGLSGNAIYAVLEDSARDLWVATTRGIDRLDRERGINTRYRHDPGDPTSMKDQDVTVFYQDSDGMLWLGTRRGISRFDRQSDKFFHLEPDPGDPHSLIGGAVYDIVEARPGVLWIGGKGGLNRFDTRQRRFTRFRHDSRRQDSLGAGTLYDLHQDRQGNLWIGIMGSGLSLLEGAGEAGDLIDSNQQSFRHFRHDPDNPNSLSSDSVGVIHEDREGSLWVGTLGGGLNRIDFETTAMSRPARFRHYRENDGLANDNILAILEDDEGFLWLSSYRGLTRFDPRTGSCKSFDYEDGLQGSAFTLGSATRTAAGELIFGGPFGLSGFFADRLDDDPRPPPVAITEFRLSNRSVPFAERGHGGTRPGEPELTLTYRDRIFGFEFAALHFGKPAKNQYRYQLQGFSEEWVETDASNRFAQYTDLDAGDYRFRVQAANPDGVWNQEGASVRIEVLPPPWKTWWAYSFYAAALVAAGLGYGHSHRQQLRRERQAAERERQAAERERAVSRRLREVDKLKDEFLANTSHELRTPLYGITGIVESLIDGATGELPVATKDNLAMVVASGRRLSHLVNDILDLSKLRHKGLEIDRRPVDLHALTDVVLTLSAGLVGAKDLRLVNAVAPDLPAADADENRLQQILYNLIGNAIKFTEAGRVEVSAAVEGDRLVVRVADTGIGIPPGKQERIFDAFEQADASIERDYGGTGLGLALTRQLVELHGGTIGLESTTGVGSTFSFSLEVAAAARAEPPAASPAAEHPIRERDEPATAPTEAAAGALAAPTQASADAPRVLVVDDEPVNLQVVRNYLAAEDFELTLASSGEQALRLLEKESFDLMLVDIMMPKVSGYEVCRTLRKKHSISDLPVIFLTAKSQDSDAVAGMALGANDYLTKPISKDLLLARIRPHLDLLQVHRSLEDLVEEKVSEIKVLEGLLPICAGCKKIRDDGGDWSALEVFISAHSEAHFSHGMCPDCIERFYKQHPELAGFRGPS